MIEAARPASANPTTVGSPPLAIPRCASDVPQEFEAMILRPLLDVALPRGEAVFGGGTSGGTWRSMLVDALARDWAERGSLGLAERFLPPPSEAAADEASPIARTAHP